MDTGGLLAILFIIGAIIFYFLPSIVADKRNHNNLSAIMALNLFLGWTFLGWVIALVWALTDNVAKDVAPSAVYDKTGDLGQGPAVETPIEAERKEPPFRT